MVHILYILNHHHHLHMCITRHIYFDFILKNKWPLSKWTLNWILELRQGRLAMPWPFFSRSDLRSRFYLSFMYFLNRFFLCHIQICHRWLWHLNLSVRHIEAVERPTWTWNRWEKSFFYMKLSNWYFFGLTHDIRKQIHLWTSVWKPIDV